MEHGRRKTDLIIDKIEEDVRELRDRFGRTEEKVSEIREKVNDGFGDSIEALKLEVQEFRKLSKEIHGLIIQNTPEIRLANCPLKAELEKKFYRRFYLWIALGTVIISTASFVGSLLGG